MQKPRHTPTPQPEVKRMSNESPWPHATPVGTAMYHTLCTYHGDVGIYATVDDCNAAACDHIIGQHADAEGNVAPTAEVQIMYVLHFSTANALEVKRSRAKPDESKTTKSFS